MSLALALFACDGNGGSDGGTTGMDGSIPPGTDAGDGGGGGMDGMIPPGPDGCVPQIEICGDRMDQNCDGRDQGCGDNDMDGIMACRAGDDLTMCDCDDARADVRPPFGGGLAGAPELCDGVDNDCNGRIDEHAECCDGCSAVVPRSRADVCTVDGTCDCSTDPSVGPCAAGQTCCTGGCTDVLSDRANCGSCNAPCTAQSDRCTGGECRCGSAPPCLEMVTCTGGPC